MATAVLGLQWGDEGKGKITHLLAGEADMVVPLQSQYRGCHRGLLYSSPTT